MRPARLLVKHFLQISSDSPGAYSAAGLPGRAEVRPLGGGWGRTSAARCYRAILPWTSRQVPQHPRSTVHAPLVRADRMPRRQFWQGALRFSGLMGSSSHVGGLSPDTDHSTRLAVQRQPISRISSGGPGVLRCAGLSGKPERRGRGCPHPPRPGSVSPTTGGWSRTSTPTLTRPS